MARSISGAPSTAHAAIALEGLLPWLRDQEERRSSSLLSIESEFATLAYKQNSTKQEVQYGNRNLEAPRGLATSSIPGTDPDGTGDGGNVRSFLRRLAVGPQGGRRIGVDPSHRRAGPQRRNGLAGRPAGADGKRHRDHSAGRQPFAARTTKGREGNERGGLLLLRALVGHLQ